MACLTDKHSLNLTLTLTLNLNLTPDSAAST